MMCVKMYLLSWPHSLKIWWIFDVGGAADSVNCESKGSNMSEGCVQAVCLHPRTQMVKCLLSLKCAHQQDSALIGDNELRWEEKFVSTLVKNMLNRSYEELMKALASRGGQPTKCVFIKRYLVILLSFEHGKKKLMLRRLAQLVVGRSFWFSGKIGRQ